MTTVQTTPSALTVDEARVESGGPTSGAVHYPTESESAWRRGLVLSVFVAISTVNILDRQVLSIANEALKHDLRFSDSQLGLLSGAAFAVFYALFGLPMAWLADRTDRPRLIAIIMAFWSAATAFCGLATSFAQMALGRMGVAIGESGATPSIYSLVSDRYPPQKRALALAIAGIGSSLGTFIGLFAGGLVVQRWGWRSAFYIAAAPGFVVALAAVFLVRDPRRSAVARPAKPRFVAQLQIFWRSPEYRWLLIGGLFSGMVIYSNASWMPSFFQRIHGWSPREAGGRLGITLGIAGAIGSLLTGVFINRWSRRNLGASTRIASLLLVLGAPMLIIAIYAQSPWLSLGMFAASLLAAQGSAVAFQTSSQNLAASDARALAASISLIVFNLGGMTIGAGLVGFISDKAVAMGHHSLQAGMIVAPSAAFLGAIAYALSAAARRASAR